MKKKKWSYCEPIKSPDSGRTFCVAWISVLGAICSNLDSIFLTQKECDEKRKKMKKEMILMRMTFKMIKEKYTQLLLSHQISGITTIDDTHKL